MSDRCVAITVGPYTQPFTDALMRWLDAEAIPWKGYNADGDGGRSLETDIHSGTISGVIDATLTELGNELFGVHGAGPDRLTAAAMVGIPQLIVLGGLDIVMQPESRRSSPQENDKLGLEIAQKACAARGKTMIVMPLQGLSSLDIVGSDWHNSKANEALFQSIRNSLYSDVALFEVDHHVNAPEFAQSLIPLLPVMGV